MENLKIKVNTPEESKEAQELFFELGYEWHGSGKSVSYLESSASGEFGYLVAWKPGCFSKHIIQMGCGKEDATEITFPQLRDKVAQKCDQPDAVASPNDIARTAEVHREHKLANELNDICAEFGCLVGMDRMTWLRDRLRGARKPETLYHYSASINTARGTVAYDGVIAFRGRITGIEDYQQARAEIAKDGNVAPEQVNVHSLSIVS